MVQPKYFEGENFLLFRGFQGFRGNSKNFILEIFHILSYILELGNLENFAPQNI